MYRSSTKFEAIEGEKIREKVLEIARGKMARGIRVKKKVKSYHEMRNRRKRSR